MERLALVALLLASQAQALTRAQVEAVADVRLGTLWVDVIRPGELAWFASHGTYGQCLYTKNLPANAAADPVVEKLLPVTDVHIGDSNRESCRDIFGAVSIDVSLPFALAVYVYPGGFIGRVWVRHEGTTYTKAQNYGPESWLTFDWREVTEAP